ncbi:MAG: oligosaccharide flippase family protein [Bacilli bacterium]|nr:oligosaccharide flippase family protein [Bacilli bacterium]
MIWKLFIKNTKLLSNFSYLALLEVFLLIAPLITYPYLVKVLGRELYGWVITGQITASYCTVLIDFGFKRISARHIAINSTNPIKMGEVVSVILTLRWILWILSFIIYFAIICIIPSYHNHLKLFIFSFLTTLSSVVFLDFYFQGIENMKYITIINIVVRGLFVAATFIVIRKPTDYVYVPLLWSIGYILGGVISTWIVFFKHKLPYTIPRINLLKSHMREGSIIFVSDAMMTIKDKLNYNLMGAMIGMSDIVIYDIGSKIVNLLLKPITILSTVLFPQMAKQKSVTKVKKAILLIFVISVIGVLVTNVFLPWIVKFFILEDIDINAIRLYSIVPIILGVSSFITINVFFAFGYDKLVLNSTYITTIGYLVILGIMYYCNLLNSVMSFVILTVSAFLIELMYRGLKCIEILKRL